MEKIVYLEKKFLKIHKERSDKLIKRSRQDVQDQFDEIILSTKSSAIQSTFEMANRASRISDKESRLLRRIRLRENMNIINHCEGLSSDDEEPKSAISSRQNEIGINYNLDNVSSMDGWFLVLPNMIIPIRGFKGE